MGLVIATNNIEAMHNFMAYKEGTNRYREKNPTKNQTKENYCHWKDLHMKKPFPMRSKRLEQEQSTSSEK